MSDFMIIGKYWPGESPIHRMDPRAKLVLSLVVLFVVLFSQNFFSLGIAAIFIFGFHFISQVPLKQALKSILPLLVLVAFYVVFSLFSVQSGTVVFEWWIIRLTTGGLMQGLFIACRMFLLLFSMSLLTLTTTTLDITDAFEYLLKPFARIGLPAHELSMIMGIALRFMPQFVNEVQTIYRAQISRGATFATGGLRAKTRMFSSIIVPLFTSAFRHAETLSLAMDARCYHGGPGRTRLHPLHYTRRDAVALIVVIVMSVALITSNILL